MVEVEVASNAAGRQQIRVRSESTAAWQWVCVVLLLTVGVWIRTLYLDALPFWVDEAESSINALTILQHGYPTDSYLGIPIYENTHVSPWPNNSEYEFRDISYTDRGFAVYHGWLPLYAMAGSFALHGIRADIPDGSLHIKHNLAEQKRLSRAARLPAVLFAVVFLLLVFLGGFALYGRDAAWTGLILWRFLSVSPADIGSSTLLFRASDTDYRLLRTALARHSEMPVERYCPGGDLVCAPFPYASSELRHGGGDARAFDPHYHLPSSDVAPEAKRLRSDPGSGNPAVDPDHGIL